MPLGGDDVVVSLPRPVGELTYDEWHSALLAIVPGWLIGFGVLLGHHELVFYLVLGMVTTAGILRTKDLPKIGPALARAGVRLKKKAPALTTKAAGVIRREPWYFLTVLAVIGAATYGVGSWPWL